MKLVRETAHQSKGDMDYLNQADAYWNASPGNSVEKLETFTKFVSRQALTKFIARLEIFKLQQDINGSIVEVGVHRGASLMSWAHFSSILEPVNYLRKIIGFDTFEGFPEVGIKDSKGVSEHLKKGGFSCDESPELDLLNAINIFDVNRLMNHIPKCEIIKGDVSKTLPQYLEENPHLLVSLLHLDADLYEPTKTSLQLLLPRMPKGAIILFDELNMKLFPGETLALLEILPINKYSIRRFSFATSMSYLVIE
jgi:hypothetical protein